jgi:hypothetical protein
MLIGLTGYAQHGKDTAAQVLVEEYGYARVAFADPLKDLAVAVNPLVSLSAHDPSVMARLRDLVVPSGLHTGASWETAKKNPEVRRLLQELGTGARAILGDDIWVRTAERRILEAAPRPVVVSDVRFPNEADFITRHSGEVWRIVRLNADASNYDNGLGISHPSEAGVGAITPRRVLFARDVEELRAAVVMAVEGVMA